MIVKCIISTILLYFLSIGNTLVVNVNIVDTKLSYDYIVVGSGSAGSIIAERLALSGASVLVIEAGAESSGFFNGPDVVSTKGQLDPSNTYVANRKLTKYDVPLYWSSAYLNLKKWDIPGATVAKVMGGCGVHNGMVFQRGKEQDYDDWNIPGWKFNDLFPYLKKLYTILDPELQQNALHGHSGRIQVGKREYDVEGSVFLESCKSAGLPFNSDFQNETRDGCGYFQFNINSQGERSSSLHEYLQPASQRPNVDILINAQVTNVIIDKELISQQYYAKGVRYFITTSTDPSIKSVFARKEVILCAGSLNTPKILMHSGIGSSTYLSAFNVRIPKVYSNLPGVGKNLQNHHLFFMIYQYSQCSPNNRFPLYNQDLSYSTTGTGIFATPGYSVGAWLRANSSVPEAENVMLLLPGTIGSVTPFPSISIGVGYPELNEHYVELNRMGIGYTLLDFYRLPPKVNYTPTSKPEDIEKGVRGLKEAHRIMSSSPINLVSNIVQPSFVDDDDYLREYVKNSTIGHDHWVGTCKMGLKSDPMAVVDERLKVIGIKKLRVVDGSVIPRIPFGLVHATIMTIAEKAADLIIQDNK
ncbi:hypothetical protein CYY_001526 [Polysphondylium violaceum]|uniref:Glucose-methanol-choline oxidoreductase N-terminal domain-containing protein n=1 Tax=Polysphondylium violaceum TaxID=133409 RepID=A0A8J4Q983_9MYCE|nr:hypothetical protein CYY_001526 [Polysphondylium violaceum]